MFGQQRRSCCFSSLFIAASETYMGSDVVLQ